MWCHVAEGVSMKGDGWKERCLYRRVRNLIQARWSLGRLFTVMLDVFSVLKKNSGKFILLFCSFLQKLLWPYQTEKVNGGDVNKFDLHVQQQDRVLPHWDCSSSVARRAFLMFWAFQDGWWLLKGMWSKSEMVRVRSSPPPHNKTGEKHPTMEWSWWRTFASHWPPASQTGAPRSGVVRCPE